jgi:hypothetical protein
VTYPGFTPVGNATLVVANVLTCNKHSHIHLQMLSLSPNESQNSETSKHGQIGSVFVTREHVRHNKSGIAHRGRTGINHLTELPTKLNHFCSGGQVTLPNRTREPKVCLWSAGCREVGGAASNT